MEERRAETSAEKRARVLAKPVGVRGTGRRIAPILAYVNYKIARKKAKYEDEFGTHPPYSGSTKPYWENRSEWLVTDEKRRKTNQNWQEFLESHEAQKKPRRILDYIVRKPSKLDAVSEYKAALVNIKKTTKHDYDRHGEWAGSTPQPAAVARLKNSYPGVKRAFRNWYKTKMLAERGQGRK